jgi:hypothetical protein
MLPNYSYDGMISREGAQGFHRSDHKARHGTEQNFFADGPDRFFPAGRSASRIAPLEDPKDFLIPILHQAKTQSVA